MPSLTFPDLRPDRAKSADPVAVRYLQQALISQGFAVSVNGLYDAKTIGAVHDFQVTHLGKNGQPLLPDGWVGPATWWAIQNPSGATQKSNWEANIPNGLSTARRKLLSAALKDHAAGVKEIPDGSNYGDGVTRYLTGLGPQFWCAFAVSTWHKDATGKWPFDVREGSVRRMWERAQKAGRAILREKTNTPVPGDAFVILYRDNNGRLTGLGHIGLVLTASNADNVAFNTAEGNCGNRVKVGARNVRETTLVGYIDFFGDRDTVRTQFTRGLLKKGEDVSGNTTR